jgi:hypothetical protein
MARPAVVPAAGERVKPALRRVWRDHSLVIVLTSTLAVMTVYSMLVGYQVWQQDRAGNGPFWLWWSWEYNESILADVFGGLVLVYSTKKFREAGSPESGDDDGEDADAGDH